jgi:hypothetical protein
LKFHYGKIPDSVDFFPEKENWTSLKEPSPWLAQLLALPIAFTLAGVLIFLWVNLTPAGIYDIPATLVHLLVGIPATIIVHELLHALAHPENGRSDKSILGYWPSLMVFYAHYDGVLSKKRFITILVLPFLSLSVLPLIFFIVFRIGSSFLMFVSVFNAIGSCVDLLGVIIIFFQVPACAITRNKAWRTYYRIGEAVTGARVQRQALVQNK